MDSFNVENKRHLEFVVAAANLFASCLGVPQNRDLEKIKELAKSVNAEPYVKQDVEVKEDENEEEEEDEPKLDAQNDDEMDRLTATMETIKNEGQIQADNISPVEFERDDDRHIDFIDAFSNLRATNYGI